MHNKGCNTKVVGVLRGWDSNCGYRDSETAVQPPAPQPYPIVLQHLAFPCILAYRKGHLMIGGHIYDLIKGLKTVPIVLESNCSSEKQKKNSPNYFPPNPIMFVLMGKTISFFLGRDLL